MRRARIRAARPIESTLATVRLRTTKTRGSLARETAFPIDFKLALCAPRTWRQRNRLNRLADVIEGAGFESRINIEKFAARQPQNATFDNSSAGNVSGCKLDTRQKQLYVQAAEARCYPPELLPAGSAVTLEDAELGKFFRMAARVMYQGMDVILHLMTAGLAKPMADTRRPAWCE